MLFILIKPYEVPLLVYKPYCSSLTYCLQVINPYQALTIINRWIYHCQALKWLQTAYTAGIDSLQLSLVNELLLQLIATWP